jgi:hypothetical protein
LFTATLKAIMHETTNLQSVGKMEE